MSNAPDQHEKLAVMVADGQPINWVEALSGASSEGERRIIRHLRLVESVALVHRSGGSYVPSSQESPTLPAGIGEARREDPTPASGTWGHLEIREKLGEGGFGAVYRAWDRRLDREVALKLLRAAAAPGDEAVSRFVEEGRLLAKLRHPNVVTVHGAEVHDGRTGLWMEFIRGRSLEQLLTDQGPFGAREAALIGIDLCRALAAVHQAGVIHRDVKAQNAMREEGGRILLTDFGAGVESSVEKVDKETKQSGTPFYMAPELFRGEPATQRSDLYSLGVLLYHMVTRSFPVQAGTWKELRERHARRESRLLRDQRSDLPEGFVTVIERAIAWDPEQRYATAGQMEQGLALALGSTVPAASAASAQQTATPAPRIGLGMRVAGFVVALAALVALFIVPSVLRQPAPVPVPVAPATPPAGTTVPDGSPTYTVEAAVYRIPKGSNTSERLESGARLALGDRLSLEFTASAPLYVYVINEDEEGHSYALFPLPGVEPVNPLAPDTKQVLPGMRDGKRISWTVDSPGGREHLMILASPARLVEFEAEMNTLARAGQTAVSIPESAKVHLRGIGGLIEETEPARSGSAGRLFEMAKRLASRSEVAQGVWMRRIELTNPRP